MVINVTSLIYMQK